MNTMFRIILLVGSLLSLTVPLSRLYYKARIIQELKPLKSNLLEQQDLLDCRGAFTPTHLDNVVNETALIMLIMGFVLMYVRRVPQHLLLTDSWRLMSPNAKPTALRRWTCHSCDRTSKWTHAHCFPQHGCCRSCLIQRETLNNTKL